MADLRSVTIPGDGVRLHALVAGAGRPVVLLHGFPESAAAWTDQLHALAPHARIVAPDLRGYGASDRPAEVAAYALPRLVADVDAVVDWLGERPVLVGHDWGGVVAWAYAAAHAERLVRLVIVNAPHPSLLAARIADTPAQAHASAYIAALTAPEFETAWHGRMGELWDRVFGAALAAGHLTAVDRTRAVVEWSRPGALTAMLAWYRANPVGSLAAPFAAVPTHVLWGMADTALLPCLLDGLEATVPDLSVTRVPAASHWIVHERPDLVTAIIRAALDAVRS